MDPEVIFHDLGSSISDAVPGFLFGRPCYKMNGKAFMFLYNRDMVFKLSGEAHRDAISYDGAQLFDPSGKGRPMKEWVQLPPDYSEQWTEFANAAAEYLRSLTK